MDGRKVDVTRAVPSNKQPNRPRSNNQGGEGPAASQIRTNKIFVKRLDLIITKDALKKFFEQFGPIIKVDVVLDIWTQTPLGFGSITFVSEDAVEKVMQKSVYKVRGKTVEVQKFIPKEMRAGSRLVGEARDRTGGNYVPSLVWRDRSGGPGHSAGASSSNDSVGEARDRTGGNYGPSLLGRYRSGGPGHSAGASPSNDSVGEARDRPGGNYGPNLVGRDRSGGPGHSAGASSSNDSVGEARDRTGGNYGPSLLGRYRSGGPGHSAGASPSNDSVGEARDRPGGNYGPSLGGRDYSGGPGNSAGASPSKDRVSGNLSTGISLKSFRDALVGIGDHDAKSSDVPVGIGDHDAKSSDVPVGCGDHDAGSSSDGTGSDFSATTRILIWSQQQCGDLDVDFVPKSSSI